MDQLVVPLPTKSEIIYFLVGAVLSWLVTIIFTGRSRREMRAAHKKKVRGLLDELDSKNSGTS